MRNNIGDILPFYAAVEKPFDIVVPVCMTLKPEIKITGAAKKASTEKDGLVADVFLKNLGLVELPVI